MRTQRTADLWSGLFLAGLGLVVLVSSLQIKAAIAERLPPATLPLTLGSLLTLGGLLLAHRSWRSPEENLPVEWPNVTGAKRVLWALLGLAAYIALIEPLGLPLASGLFTFGLVWYLDHRWQRDLIIGVVTGLVTYYVFIELLGLSFPVGPWTD